MRHILHILLLFVLLTVVAGGCRRSPGEDERRLIAIDSLIAAHPDSALTLLAEVDTAALAEPERAYHALLTVQAAYKAYIPATSDSLIARAWRYYEHGGPYDRRVRAMIHQGTVAEELGHPEQAMRWYKQAEAFARPDDHYNRGYALMRQADIYKDNYAVDNIDKYKQALWQFRACGNSHYQIICLAEIGASYSSTNADSTLAYMHQADSEMRVSGDHELRAANYTQLALFHVFNNDAEQALHYASLALDSCQAEPADSLKCRLMLSYLAAKRSQCDQARQLLPPAGDIATPQMLTLFHETRALMAACEGDSLNYFRYRAEAESLAGHELLVAHSRQLHAAEANYEAAQAQIAILQEHGHTMRMLMLLGAAVLLIALLCYIIWRMHADTNKKILALHNDMSQQRRSFERVQAELDEEIRQKQFALAQATAQANGQSDEINRMTTELKALQGFYGHLQAGIGSIVKSLKQLSGRAYEYEGNPEKFLKTFKRSVKELNDNLQFWAELERHVNRTHNNVMERIYELHGQLTPQEHRLVLLTLLDFDIINIAICLGYKNPSVVSTAKTKLKSKLKLDKPLDKYLQELSAPANDAPAD